MSSTYISASLRRLVVARAEGVCEYCLIHEDDSFFGFEVDHVISEKHSGLTQEDNLAYACFSCNRNKGSDIASLIPESSLPVRFYHPRLNPWSDHLRLDDADGITIVPLTDVGEATARIFGFNDGERLLERRALSLLGRFPVSAALKRVNNRS